MFLGVVDISHPWMATIIVVLVCIENTLRQLSWIAQVHICKNMTIATLQLRLSFVVRESHFTRPRRLVLRAMRGQRERFCWVSPQGPPVLRLACCELPDDFDNFSSKAKLLTLKAWLDFHPRVWSLFLSLIQSWQPFLS